MSCLVRESINGDHYAVYEVVDTCTSWVPIFLIIIVYPGPSLKYWSSFSYDYVLHSFCIKGRLMRRMCWLMVWAAYLQQIYTMLLQCHVLCFIFMLTLVPTGPDIPLYTMWCTLCSQLLMVPYKHSWIVDVEAQLSFGLLSLCFILFQSTLRDISVHGKATKVACYGVLAEQGEEVSAVQEPSHPQYFDHLKFCIHNFWGTQKIEAIGSLLPSNSFDNKIYLPIFASIYCLCWQLKPAFNVLHSLEYACKHWIGWKSP